MAVIAALVRHGHYEQPEGVPSAHLHHPLTDKGRQQSLACAEAVAALAAERGWALHGRLHVSPLRRAWETGVLMAERLGGLLGRRFEVDEYAALAERSLGAAANLTVGAIEEALARDPRYGRPAPGWKAASAHKLPFLGAESLLEAGARLADHVRTHLDALAAETPAGGPEGCQVFVAHGGAIRHAAYHLGVLRLEGIAGLSMYHAQPVYLALDAAGDFTHVAGQWKVRPRDDARDSD